MRVGFFQFSPMFGDVKANLKKVDSALLARLDLLVLPELCCTGYQFVSRAELEELGEVIPEGPTTQALIEMAGKIQGTVVGGVLEKEKERYFNAAVVVAPSGFVGKYRKLHLFLEEKKLFTPGDLPLPVFEVGAAKIGLMICFDWVFPEAARTLALKGAEIICLPANLILPFCQRTMQVRALENRVFTVVANRVGEEQRGGEKRLRFTGRSQITDTQGEILVSAGEEEETLLWVDIDPHQAQNKLFTEKNDLFADRRSNYYEL